MARTMRRVVILLVTILIASSMLILQARAHTEYDTTTTLSVVPNPVGVGQQILGTGVVSASVPPPENIFHGLYVEITKPDGTKITTEAFDTQTDGSYYFTYTPNLVGTWSFNVSYPGESSGIDSSWWKPSYSICYVTVQVEPVLTIYPDPTDPRVSLTFEEITSSGTATVDKAYAPPPDIPPLSGIKGLYYDFTVTFSFTGTVEVGIPYDDTGLTRKSECRLGLWHYQPVAGDVNSDGKVNLKDILIIASALGTRPGNRHWNPACDLNSDGKVNLSDLCIALRNFGKTSPAWVNITTRIDTVNNIIYGATDLFSIFGVR
jgi:hypothetical protein